MKSLRHSDLHQVTKRRHDFLTRRLLLKNNHRTSPNLPLNQAEKPVTSTLRTSAE